MALAVEQTKRQRKTSATAGTDDDDDSRKQREELIQQWLQQLPNTYPHLLTKTHFIPPVHVNKMALTELQPTSVAKSQEFTKLSDFRDDRAQLTVERVFWRLAQERREKDVMVVLSNFSLDNYLNKTLSGASCVPRRKKRRGRGGGRKAKAEDPQVKELFPTPEDPSLARGEFDLLFVHKDYGFLIIEIKAIGDIAESEDGELEPLEDRLGGKEVNQALRQLNKRQRQLEIITSDLKGPQIPVTKIAAFPHVTRDKLREVMTNPVYTCTLNEELTKYLGADIDLDNSLKYWLCEDEIQGTMTSEGMQDDVRMTWWEGLLSRMKSARTAEFHGIEDDAYKQLVARLCGPMSTVEVWRGDKPEEIIHEARDQADAIHAMSTWCKRWILRPEQLEWFHCWDPFVYLTGPPGSGKTLLLLVKAENRVKQGNTMVVVVRGPGNLPGHLISQLLHSQIRAALKDSPQYAKTRVLLETLNAWTDPEEFVRCMMQKAQSMEAEVMFLVDELWLSNPSAKMLNLLREMVGMLEDCRKDVEASLVAAYTGTQPDSASSASSTWKKSSMTETESSKPSTASYSLPTSKAAKTGSRTLQEALGSIKQKLKNLHTAHDIATDILTEAVQEEERKLLSVADEMLEDLTGKGQSPHPNEPDISVQVVEKVSDVEFYVDVLTSWMASPVLHAFMQEARGHDDVSLWCTGFWPNRCPQGYQTGRLPDSIRCPCYIQELLDKTELLASHQGTKQHEYSSTSTQANPPLPAEAPPLSMVTPIDHGLHVPVGGDLTCVSQCAQCADQLATLLLDTLHVGPGSRVDFRDVLIVGRALLPIKPDSAFVRKLRERGIPVSVVVTGSDDLQHQDGGLHANTVLITNTYNGHGLERSVVVFVPDIKHCRRRDSGCDGGAVGDGGGGGGSGFMESLGQFNEMGVWFIASRSLAQFVVFHV